MTIDRRTFLRTAIVAGAAAVSSGRALAQTLAGTQARNIVLVHGLFADGSSWSEVIPLLQAQGLTVTSVQNPLTTLPDAVAAARRVLDRQDGPTVLAGHSFSGMIVTEAGVHPSVSALVYVAARAPDAGEDYSALAAKFPAAPASAGIVFDGDEGRLSEEAFLRDFRRSARGEGKGALCRPRAIPQGAAPRTHDQRRLAQQAELLCGLDRGSNDQPRPAALHGETHEREDDRAQVEPSFAHLTSRCDRAVDPGSGRAGLKEEVWSIPRGRARAL